MTLEVSGLSKAYGSGADRIQALDDVSFDVANGEVVALVGNNGAGKSTLMSISAGLLAADRGTVEAQGHETTRGGGSPTHHLGLAPQEEALYPTLTVRRNLEYFGRLAGLPRARLADRVETVAQELLLGDLLDRSARELSGGQRRRLHTALALMHSPEVLLLDEPTVGVDIDARLQLLQFVLDMAAGGAAVLYSTHQMQEVERIASRAVVLHHGRVLAVGGVDELVAAHARRAARLRIAGTGHQLWDSDPDRLLGVRETPEGDTVLDVATDDGHGSVVDLVDGLPAGMRELVTSVELQEPSFERAYLALVREADGVTRPTGTEAVAR